MQSKQGNESEREQQKDIHSDDCLFGLSNADGGQFKMLFLYLESVLGMLGCVFEL